MFFFPQEAGEVVWYSHLLKNSSPFVVIPTVKSFGIVKKAEIDVFLELSCFFHDPADVWNLISDSSAFSKTSLNIWKFTVHVLLKPGLENFEHYFKGGLYVWCCIVFTVKRCDYFSQVRSFCVLHCLFRPCILDRTFWF